MSGNPVRDTKEDIQKYVEYLSSLVIQQMQIKTTLRIHIQVEWLTLKT